MVYISHFFLVDIWGAWKEEKEEGEKQNRCRQVPQQEEGKDWITPEGSFPLSSIWALVILHLVFAFLHPHS